MSPAQLSELETLAAKFSVEITQALPYATDEEHSSYLSQLRLIEAHSKVEVPAVARDGGGDRSRSAGREARHERERRSVSIFAVLL